MRLSFTGGICGLVVTENSKRANLRNILTGTFGGSYVVFVAICKNHRLIKASQHTLESSTACNVESFVVAHMSNAHRPTSLENASHKCLFFRLSFTRDLTNPQCLLEALTSMLPIHTGNSEE
jgi:hypothetical protein